MPCLAHAWLARPMSGTSAHGSSIRVCGSHQMKEQWHAEHTAASQSHCLCVCTAAASGSPPQMPHHVHLLAFVSPSPIPMQLPLEPNPLPLHRTYTTSHATTPATGPSPLPPHPKLRREPIPHVNFARGRLLLQPTCHFAPIQVMRGMQNPHYDNCCLPGQHPSDCFCICTPTLLPHPGSSVLWDDLGWWWNQLVLVATSSGIVHAAVWPRSR